MYTLPSPELTGYVVVVVCSIFNLHDEGYLHFKLEHEFYFLLRFHELDHRFGLIFNFPLG